MSLSSLHLDAFFAAAQSLNFSQAAKELHITQSALSQRIKALEEDLNLTLFVRLPRGVQLTEAGERLLRYCQARGSLERELLDHLTGGEGRAVGGMLRIAGYSSVARSVILPALTPLLRENPRVQPHVQSNEIRSLPEMLITGQVDFIVTDTEVHRNDFASVTLGEEEYVMCASADHAAPEDIFLDHDPSDPITNAFFAGQNRPVPEYRRAFLAEVYAIIDGVAAGLGRAVVSRHLIRHDSRVHVVSGYEPMRVPVFLHYHKQPFYTQLHKLATAALTANVPALLSPVTEP